MLGYFGSILYLTISCMLHANYDDDFSSTCDYMISILVLVLEKSAMCVLK